MAKRFLCNFPVLLMAGYFLVAWLVELAGGVDITPPCLWKTIFDVHCPGCGLNTAGKNLASMNFAAAWESNPVIYLIAPVVGYVVFGEVKRGNIYKSGNPDKKH